MPISLLARIANIVGQRHLPQLRRITVVGRPIREARTKAVNRVARSKLDKQVHHLTFMAGGDLAFSASGESKHLFCERDEMLLHAFCGATQVSPSTRLVGSLAMRARSLGNLISDRVAPSVSLARAAVRMVHCNALAAGKPSN